MKWNESGFRPPLCTYRLNWAGRTSWGWWDDWDDTVLQTQDSKFKPWRSEAEHATSRSRRLPTILTFTRGWGRNIFLFQTAETGNRTPDSGVKGSGANHYPRAPALPYGRVMIKAWNRHLEFHLKFKFFKVHPPLKLQILLLVMVQLSGSIYKILVIWIRIEADYSVTSLELDIVKIFEVASPQPPPPPKTSHFFIVMV